MIIELSLFIDESLYMDNVTRKDLREQVMATGLTDEALLSGDLNTVERLVYNNETLVGVNFSVPPLKGTRSRPRVRCLDFDFQW